MNSNIAFFRQIYQINQGRYLVPRDVIVLGTRVACSFPDRPTDYPLRPPAIFSCSQSTLAAWVAV
jgi:hypothetical protein